MNEIYTYRPSYGWLWVFGIGLFILGALLLPTILFWQQSPLWVSIMDLGIGLIIGVPFIYIGLQIPGIRYALADDALHISMGRLIHYTVRYQDIESVVSKNLSISLWAGMRFPGLALFKVIYVDEGLVNMCATSAATNILLIKTGSAKFGITPSNEAEFVQSLMSKLK